MSDKLSFLNQNEQVKLPEGGGDFAPTGFIGKTYAQILFSFMSQEDSKQHKGAPQYAGRRQAGSYFVYYMNSQAEAKALMSVLGVEGYQGKEPVAQEVWNLQINRDTVLNFADQTKLDKWANPIALDVRVMTLASKKYRHEFQMLALPLAVQAMAKFMEYQYEPFSISELIKKPEEMVYSDEWFAAMFGSPDAKKDAPDHYSKSTMWGRRAALWESLGETNAEAYQPIGSGKFATKSEKLSQCLQIVGAKWNSPIWARVITIPDPRVDAQTDEGKRFTLPALFEIFGDEATAKSAAKADLERLNASSNGNGNGATKSLPIPAAYVGEYEQMWRDNVAKVKGEFATKPAPPVVAAQAKGLGVTPEELTAWAWN